MYWLEHELNYYANFDRTKIQSIVFVVISNISAIWRVLLNLKRYLREWHMFEIIYLIFKHFWYIILYCSRLALIVLNKTVASTLLYWCWCKRNANRAWRYLVKSRHLRDICWQSLYIIKYQTKLLMAVIK